MQPGYYNATGGMVTQLNRLDIIANNIANAYTNGFKRDDVVIGDFQRLYKEAEDELPLFNHTKEAAKFLNRSLTKVPQIVEQYTEKALGPFMQTDNKLDFALQRENLYFGVLTPAGIRYTRDGAFILNENGRLVTKDGYPILARESTEDAPVFIDIPENSEFSVDKDGNIYIGGDVIANIGVFEAQNPKYLQKEGSNLYKNIEPNLMIVNENSRSVINGFIEKSNINVVKEMVALIETNRLVEMYQKVLKTHGDELDDTAINRLAIIKA